MHARDEEQDTPLHAAAEHGQLEVIELLLDNEAEIDAIGKDGDTPLRLATQGGRRNEGAVELLLRRGAKPPR